MFMLLKFLVPVASAAAVFSSAKPATPISHFEGSYSVVSGNCGAENMIVSIHLPAALTVTGNEGKLIAIIPQINLGRVTSGSLSSDSKYDGFGTLTSVAFDKSSFETTQIKMILEGSRLLLKKQIHEGYSRAGSKLDMQCELKKN